MSPTYERSARFERDMRKLTGEQRRAFLSARDDLIAGLRAQPPQFALRLRVKRVQGHLWLRIGKHAILDDPEG